VLIGWDFGARGIWWVLTREEKEGPGRPGRWTSAPPAGWHNHPRPWSDRLSGGLLDELQAWNDAWTTDDADPLALEERGRDLAIRVQNELGTDGWEVLYRVGGRMFRVDPPGSWPIGSWQQELLGYRPQVPESSRPPGI
jgi:hypothetical protein